MASKDSRASKDHPNGGYRNCLKCDKKFFSIDLTCNRLCKLCNRENKGLRTTKVYKISDAQNIEIPQDES